MSHDNWRDMTAPYALGMQEPEERVLFEEHLAGCAECRAELQSFNETVAAMGSAVPMIEPSATLRQRILHEARKSRPVQVKQRSVLPWQVAAAASFLLAAGGVFGVWRAEQEQKRLQTALNDAEAANATASRQALARDSLIDAITGANSRSAILQASGRPPSARVFYNPRSRYVVLSLRDLPRAPDGRTYQLWAIATGGKPVSLGTFDGTGASQVITLHAPEDQNFTIAAVTEEPAGGSLQPTTTPFLTGQLSE